MEAIANAANWIIGLFGTAGATWWGLVTALVPLMMVFLTFMHSLTIFIGEERVEKWAEKLTKYALLRYTVLPIVVCVFLTATGSTPIGMKIVPDKYKGAYMDSVMTFLHPSAGLFPHVHPTELFVFMGIANGLTELGLPIGNFAVRALLAVIPIMLLRGIITEKIFENIYKRNQDKLVAAAK